LWGLVAWCFVAWSGGCARCGRLWFLAFGFFFFLCVVEFEVSFGDCFVSFLGWLCWFWCVLYFCFALSVRFFGCFFFVLFCVVFCFIFVFVLFFFLFFVFFFFFCFFFCFFFFFVERGISLAFSGRTRGCIRIRRDCGSRRRSQGRLAPNMLVKISG